MKALKPILLLLAGAFIVLATLWFHGSDSSLGATGALTTFTNPINFDQAVTLDSTFAATGAATLSSTLDVTGAVTVDEFTQGGGSLTISTTSATYTLTQSELASNNLIKIASVVTSPALALTLPATSTMTTLLASDGDTRYWTIWNAHTAAATTTTVTAGTGIDLQGDGTGDDVVNGGVFAKLICTRLPTTDVMCYINEGVAAD